MYLSIIFLPLIGSIISGFFGRKVGVTGAQLITSLFVIITSILSLFAFFEVGFNNSPVSFSLFRWIDSESLNILWGFRFDSLTVSMLIPVLIVSSLVHIYSIGYMNGDPHNQRFFSYLSLFTFMMIILVTANNFLLMFVGWEGVGICSYLLVNFWYTRIAANQSSISAFLTNRVGDCFLTVGMFAILWSCGNIDYTTVFSLAPYINENIITLIGICLLIGAMAKSSQVGLHVWLPMAMEGPTPVSALIHAATMVTAGVYLLMRCSPLIEYSSTALILCLWIGALTTVFSSLIGLFQQDIKKVIAYSTMSQLGMMVIAVGLSSYNVALFHLVNHAFYKALLFLGAGSVIHAVSDNQDFRKFGGLKRFLPLTYSVMLIASLSLVAFPFMTGFYSKDFILETAYGIFSLSGIIVYFIATIAAMFTTLYSVKVLYLTFITNPNGSLVDYKRAHEGDIFMSSPLIILAVFSIFFGFITKDIFIGVGSDFFVDNGLFIHPSHEILLDTEFAVSTLFKLLPLFFTILLSILSIIYSELLSKFLIRFKFSNIGYNIFSFFNQRFFIELFYNKYITNLVLSLGGQTTKTLDKGSIEYFGPFGLEKGLINLSKNISRLDTGVITSYALYILIGYFAYISISYLAVFDIYYFFIIAMGIISINNWYIYNTINTDKIILESNIIGLNLFNNNKFICNRRNFSTTRALFFRPSNDDENMPDADDDDDDDDDLMDVEHELDSNDSVEMGSHPQGIRNKIEQYEQSIRNLNREIDEYQDLDRIRRLKENDEDLDREDWNAYEDGRVKHSQLYVDDDVDPEAVEYSINENRDIIAEYQNVVTNLNRRLDESEGRVNREDEPKEESEPKDESEPRSGDSSNNPGPSNNPSSSNNPDSSNNPNNPNDYLNNPDYSIYKPDDDIIFKKYLPDPDHLLPIELIDYLNMIINLCLSYIGF